MYHLMRKIQDMFLTSIKIFWWRPFSKFQLKPLQESLDLSSDEEISSDSEISELSSDTSDVSSTDSDTSDAFIGGKKEKIKRRVKKSRVGKNGTIEDYSSDESSGTSVYDEISVYSSSQVKLRSQKVGRFDKLPGWARSHFIVIRGSVSLSCGTTSHPSCFSES